MGWYHCYLGKALPKALILVLFLTAVEGVYGQGLPVTLGWIPNLERDTAGYRLYYGTDPRSYTHRIDVGNTVTATVAGLPVGSIYYFAVTAYNRVGFESLFSNSVTYVVPFATPTPGQTPTPTPAATPAITVLPSTLTFMGVSGGTVPAPQTLQVTTSNGVSWSASTNSPWFDIAPVTGTSGSSTTVTPHTAGLVPGTYVQQISFMAFGLPERIVVVTLVLSPPSTPTSMAHDDFNRPDGDLGPNWIKDPAWGGGLTIANHRAITANSGVEYWAGNIFGADQYSQVRLTGAMGTWSGVLVRGSMRPGPYYLARSNPSGTDLYSSGNNSFVQLVHDPRPWVTGDILRLEVRTLVRNTAHLTVYRNGTELFSYNDTTTFIANGQPGIGLRAGITGMSIDDWEGGVLGDGSR